jgi:phytoene dehydrogenase-like protein
LDAQGLQVLPSDSVVFAPQPDGSHLTIWRDTVRTVKELERFSRADAERYPAFVELMSKLAGVVGGLMRITPPDLPEFEKSDLRSLITLAGPSRNLGRKNINEFLRVLPMPVSDLLNEWFESDALKGAIAANGVRNITWGPQEAGTAYALLYDWALSDTGLFRSAGVIAGGMGSLSGAIANAARSFGAEIRTGAPVAEIILDADRATGVRLQNGEVLNARAIVSNADPRTTFTELVDTQKQSATLVRDVRNIKYRGSAARIHLALRALPEFTALSAGDATQHLRGPIQISPSMMYLQRAHDFIKYGEYSQHPYLDILIPSLSDPSLAPDGHHVMSITAKFVPYELREGDRKSQRDAFTQCALNTLSEYVPKIQDAILHQKTLLPSDLESTFGLPEGNPNHGEITLDQFFHMRPLPGYARYRMPVDGLYLCGAGAHPGGGVTGIPGQNAAREILKDLR